MSLPFPTVRLALIVVVAAVTAACGVGAGPALTPSPTPGDQPLVTIEWRGGLCPEGLCQRRVEIDGDGSVRDPGKPGIRLFVLPPATVQRLAAEIRAADFARMASRPFTGTCPMAYDGQESIYAFHAPTGVVVIASCTVAIDATDPLFRAVDAALAAIPPRP